MFEFDLEVLRRQHHRGAVIDELSGEVPHIEAAHWVEACCGLVEEQNTRSSDQADGVINSSSHPP